MENYQEILSFFPYEYFKYDQYVQYEQSLTLYDANFISDIINDSSKSSQSSLLSSPSPLSSKSKSESESFSLSTLPEYQDKVESDNLDLSIFDNFCFENDEPMNIQQHLPQVQPEQQHCQELNRLDNNAKNKPGRKPKPFCPEMSKEEREKIVRKRERNNMSAIRCLEKKRNQFLEYSEIIEQKKTQIISMKNKADQQMVIGMKFVSMINCLLSRSQSFLGAGEIIIKIFPIGSKLCDLLYQLDSLIESIKSTLSTMDKLEEHQQEGQCVRSSRISTSNMTEEQRKQHRRELNRKAAEKCRQKKKQNIDRLKSIIDQLASTDHCGELIEQLITNTGELFKSIEKIFTENHLYYNDNVTI